MATRAETRLTTILNHHSSRFPVGDWRHDLYDPSLWKSATLKRKFDARKQGVVLQGGEIVAYRESVEDGVRRVVILHERLMCPTAIGPNPSAYIDLA